MRPLASYEKFIVVVGSPDRLKIKLQDTIDKILQGVFTCLSCERRSKHTYSSNSFLNVTCSRLLQAIRGQR